MSMLSEGLVILSPRTRRRHLYSNRVSSPHPNLSIVHLLLLVVQVEVSYKFPHHFLRFVLAPLSPCPSHLQIQFHVFSLELCRQHNRRQTMNFRFLLRSSIPAEQLSSRWSLPSTTVLHQRLHPTRTNALLPLPSCNNYEFNARALPVILTRRFILRN